MSMKKLLIFAISFIMLLTAIPVVEADAAYNSLLETLKPRADIILLQSLEDDTIIFEKNINERTPPASLTKIVTAILTLENCENVETMVVVPEYVIDMLKNTNSSNAGLKAGEIISVNDLLHCMLIPSANEAAATLADYIGGGSIEKFVEMMNTFVKRIGCNDTHFVNPHGLDEEDQYTTASDMAKIAKYAMTFSKSELFDEITSLKSYTLPESNMNESRTLRNTNFLMNSGYAEYYCKYVTNGKTGSTSRAGKCVVAKASRNGYSYLAVIMKAPHDDIDFDGYDENGAFTDGKMLFEWTFEHIRYEAVMSAAEAVVEVPVNYSEKTDHLVLLPIEDLYAFVPSGVGEDSVLVEVVEGSMPESVDAPIEKGEVIGQAAVYYAGQEIARTDLVAAESIDRNVFLFIWAKIKVVASNAVFKVFAVLIAILVAAYIALIIFRNRQRREYMKKKNRMKVVNLKDFKD